MFEKKKPDNAENRNVYCFPPTKQLQITCMECVRVPKISFFQNI